MVSIDAGKAFDCVKWKFLYQVLEQFRFKNKSTLKLNYIPSKVNQESYDLNWNLRSIEYLGVTITKNLSELYMANDNKLKSRD